LAETKLLFIQDKTQKAVKTPYSGFDMPLKLIMQVEGPEIRMIYPSLAGSGTLELMFYPEVAEYSGVAPS
jgi:hypothetical protein